MQQEVKTKEEMKVSPKEVKLHVVPDPMDDSNNYKLGLANDAAYDTLLEVGETGSALPNDRIVELVERMKFKDGAPATEKDRVIFEALMLDSAVGMLHDNLDIAMQAERRQRSMVKERDDQVLKLEEDLDELAAKNQRQERYLMVGGGVGAAAAIAGIVAYMRQKKAHDAVIQALEETALLLEAEVMNPAHFDFDELANEVFDKVGSIETRSFRRPFAIKLSELERAMKLLVGLLRTSEMLALQYANLKVVAPIEVETVDVAEVKGEDEQ